jgi:hypothetical protein
MAEHVQVVTAPDDWNPQFCTMARVSIVENIQETKDSVSKIDKRIFQLLCIAIAQLCAMTGGLAYFLLTHPATASAIHSVAVK